VHHTSSRAVGSWQTTAAVRAARGPGGAGEAITLSLTQKQRGFCSGFFYISKLDGCREIHPEEFRAMGAAHVTVLAHSPGDEMGPWTGMEARLFQAPQDKQQTAYDIPNTFSST